MIGISIGIQVKVERNFVNTLNFRAFYCNEKDNSKTCSGYTQKPVCWTASIFYTYYQYI